MRGGNVSDEKIVEFSFNDIGGLIHELVHGKQFEEGELGFDAQTGKGVGLDLDNTGNFIGRKLDRDEVNTRIDENKIRKEQDDNRRALPN